MDISTTRHLIHGRRVRRSGENDSGNILASYFIPKDGNPLTKRRSFNYNAGQEIRTGAPESSDISGGEIIKLQTGEHGTGMCRDGGRAFSNANHLQTLGEEIRDGKKYRDAAYKTKLEGLVRDLKDTDKRLILCAKIIGAWMNLRGTTV